MLSLSFTASEILLHDLTSIGTYFLWYETASVWASIPISVENIFFNSGFSSFSSRIILEKPLFFGKTV